jgi:uncharacterized damage-inducible protein DinB
LLLSCIVTMTTSKEFSNHIRQVYFGGNWTSVNLKDQLSDLTVDEANTQVGELNTIVKLAYHIHYYVRTITKVLEGGPLEGKDIYSFDHPATDSASAWQSTLDTMWSEIEYFASLVEKLGDEQLTQDFSESKYGTYHRNILGLIEHTHYHLGQISIIKKMIRKSINQ